MQLPLTGTYASLKIAALGINVALLTHQVEALHLQWSVSTKLYQAKLFQVELTLDIHTHVGMLLLLQLRPPQ